MCLGHLGSTVPLVSKDANLKVVANFIIADKRVARAREANGCNAGGA